MNDNQNQIVIESHSLLSTIENVDPHQLDLDNLPSIDDVPVNLSNLQPEIQTEDGDIPGFEVPQDSGTLPIYLQEAIDQGLSTESAQVILDHVNTQKITEEQAKFITQSSLNHSLTPNNVRIVSAAVIGGASQNEIQDLLNGIGRPEQNNFSPRHSLDQDKGRNRDDQIFPESVGDQAGNYARIGMFGAFGSFLKSALSKKEIDSNEMFQKNLAAFNEREKSIGELISELANSSIASTAKKLEAQGLAEDKIKDALADFPIDADTKKNGDRLVQELAELEKFSVKLSASSKNPEELEANQDLIMDALEKMKSKVTQALPGIDLNKISKNLNSIFDEISERINRIFKALFNRLGFTSEKNSELSPG